MKRAPKILLGIVAVILIIYLALIVYASFPQKTIPISDLTNKDDLFITIANHSIHYIKQGTGKPVILVHGFGGSTYTWRKLIPLLADTYSVYALDLLGFGLSGKPPDGNYDLQSQGELVVKFIETLKIPSPTLVGHSMGGVVIGYAALRAPQQIDSLIMVSAGFYGQGAPSFLKYLFFPLDKIMAKQFYTKNVRGKSMLRSFYNKEFVTDELVDAYLLPTQTPNAIDALASMMRTVSVQTYNGIAEKLPQPTLIVWGDKDLSNLPADAGRLKREIKDSRLVFVEECGHYVQEEKPKELAKAIKDFLR
jgi:pimeloyl-ACP methyl ester carboxylesterase